MIPTLLLLACAAESDPAPVACADPHADACIAERLAALPPSQADQALADAAEIDDPMLRGATVSRWVEQHAGDIPTTQGQRLCDLLEPLDRTYCLRRLSTPHLQR